MTVATVDVLLKLTYDQSCGKCQPDSDSDKIPRLMFLLDVATGH